MTSRRTVVQGMAVAGAAVPLLVACGGGSKSATAPKSGDVAAADIPVGGGKVVESLGVVVTQPTKGDFKAFSSTCTHAGCTVGQPKGGIIQCPCHGSQYSITDGSVKRGPAPAPLPPVKIAVVGKELKIG